MEKIQYQGFDNCLRLSNDTVELIISGDFGPRILAYNFIGSENVLGIHRNMKVETELGTFNFRGGHRLWIAPEKIPETYVPDNSPAAYSFDKEKRTLKLTQPVDSISATQKELIIELDKKGSGVSLKHRIINLSKEQIEIAAWALTIMRSGGEVLIPNEPFAPYSSETLLPIRNLALWSYSDLSDSRLNFAQDGIRVKIDPENEKPQKIGVLNKQGWVKYRMKETEFTKNFEYQESEKYPDMNSNTEIYTAGAFVEIETLSPLQKIDPNQAVEHIENWNLNHIL